VGGTRVGCSRVGHAFVLKPPSSLVLFFNPPALCDLSCANRPKLHPGQRLPRCYHEWMRRILSALVAILCVSASSFAASSKRVTGVFTIGAYADSNGNGLSDVPRGQRVLRPNWVLSRSGSRYSLRTATVTLSCSVRGSVLSCTRSSAASISGASGCRAYAYFGFTGFNSSRGTGAYILNIACNGGVGSEARYYGPVNYR